MSHKSGHIIIDSLLAVPDLTTEQRASIKDIETRDRYTRLDRLYLAWLTYKLTKQ